jgi:DNA repair protein RecN (Recombination protein N)
MLRRLLLRDVVIVAELEVELGQGFTVLTGETGAGKSILIDALQLALGQRAEAGVVREGAARAEVSAEFDSPDSLRAWLDESGFAAEPLLLLRRVVDAQGDSAGRSRAWINGSPATLVQLRQAAEHLVDIHGQHAWQSLTRPAAVRDLLDSLCGADGATMTALAALWQTWRDAQHRLDEARTQQGTLETERERLLWQIGELDKLAPASGEWDALNTEHQRLGHNQALLEGARGALAALSEQEPSATVLTARAAAALAEVQRFDPELGAVVDVLLAAQAQLDDAVHSLSAYLGRREPNPERLAELDGRIGSWVSLSRRYKRSPADLPALLQGWRDDLAQCNAASDLGALEQQTQTARDAWLQAAQRVSRLRKAAAPKLAATVTQAMQSLGMAGGRFEVAVHSAEASAAPHAHGLDMVEFLVAGHAGSTPRPLGKVASGGELSRLALAIAVSTVSGVATGAAKPTKGKAPATPSNTGSANRALPALIFDEIDAGVGGTVADSVGRLMKLLGGSTQVMAVTHLAQVAACADTHFVVSKALHGKQTLSAVKAVSGAARVHEVARMLGGEAVSGAAHALTLLQAAGAPSKSPASGVQK